MMDTASLFEELPDDGAYSGPCEVVFDDPEGKVFGDATIRISEESCAVEISVAEFEVPPGYHNNLLALIYGSPPKLTDEGLTVGISATNYERRIRFLTVKTEPGIFTAASGILINPGFFGLQNGGKLSIIVNDLVFFKHGSANPRHWLMPLQGCFANHYVQRRQASHPVALTGESYIPFLADGCMCGLEIFAENGAPRHAVAKYDAIAFGETDHCSETFEGISSRVPMGLIPALSFCIGAEASTPWIEVRGSNGELVGRAFHPVTKRVTKQGHSAFARVNEYRSDSGIGVFLNMFFAATREKRTSLLVPLNLIRLGTPGSASIEDSITNLIKALDAICKAHGLTTQNLAKRLKYDNQTKVATLLDETRAKLLAIRSDNALVSDQNQVDVLDAIIGKVASANTTAREFGLSIKDLLEKLDLHDAEVLERHHQEFGQHGESWAKTLSAARGQVIHTGFLQMRDRRALRSWYDFACHLHDLCKRIIFREINYRGVYQATTNPWQGDYSVDRVKPTMNSTELGLSRLPTGI